MGFAIRRVRRPRLGRIRNNFIRASVLLAVVTPVSLYGIFGFFRAGERLEGFGWLLALLISIWILVSLIWYYSFYKYRKALKEAKSSLGSFRSRNLRPSNSVFNRAFISPIRMRSS